MRVVLLGAPDAGKAELVEALTLAFPTLGPAKGHPGLLLPTEPDRLAVGSLADYRTELALATLRALQMTSQEGLFSHSVLDNMGHEYVRFSDLGNTELLDEMETTRHFLLSGLIYAMVVDSFKADVLIWVPQPRGKITDEFAAAVDDFYPEVLDHFSSYFVTYDPDTDPEGALTSILEAIGEASGPELSSKQPIA